MQADDRDGDFADEAVTEDRGSLLVRSEASTSEPWDEGIPRRGTTELLRTLLPPPPTDDDITTELPVVHSEVRRGRRTRARSKTIALKRLTRAELAREAALAPPIDVPRPQTRAECKDAPRPCPWVACKHHLYLDINPETGSIKLNFPDLEPWELEHTCALDLADEGARTLEEIGTLTNLTRERVRQVEVRGLLRLRGRAQAL